MKINFSSDKPQLMPVEVSSDDSRKKTLMTLLLEAKLPVASSCKGDGICGKCRINVLLGQENINPQGDLELKTKQKNKIAESERLSCQVYLQGDITIDTTYW